MFSKEVSHGKAVMPRPTVPTCEVITTPTSSPCQANQREDFFQKHFR
jgi:hypothetical protein